MQIHTQFVLSFSKTTTSISTKLTIQWQSRLQLFNYWVPAIINVITHQPVRSIITKFLYLHSFYDDSSPIIFLFCDAFCSFPIYFMPCAVMMERHPIIFLCRFQDVFLVLLLAPVLCWLFLLFSGTVVWPTCFIRLSPQRILYIYRWLKVSQSSRNTTVPN